MGRDRPGDIARVAVHAVRLRPAFVTAVHTVAAHWRTWLRTAVVLQVLTALVAAPAVALLLRAALWAAGVDALTEASVGQVVRHPLALLLLLALAGVATVAVLLQHAAFVLLGRHLSAGRVPRARDLAAEGLTAARRLIGPQLGLVALYVLVLAPLGGFSLGASLARAVELPPFIAGELHKSALGTVVWLVALAVVLLANLRLVLVPTLLLTTSCGPAAAFATSWRLVRGSTARLALLTALGWGASAVLVTGLVTVAVAVTRVSDAVWPAASPLVAGVALTVVQAVLLVGGGLAVGVVSVALLCLTEPVRVAPALPPSASPPPPATHRLAVVAAVAVAVTAAVVTSVTAVQAAGSGRPTVVIAHRGATYGAAENTLESLEAAAALGADVVELDVLQTGDGGLVVLHDTNLRRLAGVNRNVFDMTTAELTATTVRQRGHTSTIPTFDAFTARAATLDVALLVELKEHGREQGDLVGDVVGVLEAHDLVDGSMVQAFDRDTVMELERRFPRVSTGSVVAFSRGRLDAGAADFVTVEQSSYSSAVLRQAHTAGVQVFVWTVTDPVRMRSLVRDGVDGMITGYPRRALEQRAVVRSEVGMAGRLEDTLRSLVDL